MKYDFHTFASISDGTSNTIAFSERLTMRGDRRGAFDGKFPQRGATNARNTLTTTDAAYTTMNGTPLTADEKRNTYGILWLCGAVVFDKLSTVLAPNSGALIQKY